MFDKLIGPQMDQKKKENFKECELSITVTSNITSVDFLDKTLNLKTESYRRLRKPKNDLKNIDINSNFPDLSKRLSKTLSSKDVFDKSKTLYEKFSNKTGFNENLMYH